MTKEEQRKMIHLFGLVYGLSNNNIPYTIVMSKWSKTVCKYIYIIILNHVAWLTCM